MSSHYLSTTVEDHNQMGQMLGAALTLITGLRHKVNSRYPLASPHRTAASNALDQLDHSIRDTKRSFENICAKDHGDDDAKRLYRLGCSPVLKRLFPDDPESDGAELRDWWTRSKAKQTLHINDATLQRFAAAHPRAVVQTGRGRRYEPLTLQDFIPEPSPTVQLPPQTD